MKPRTFFFGRLLLPVALFSFSGSALAVDIFKANNATRINDITSWYTTTGGPTNVAAVGTTDIGVFDSTVVGAITIANLSANSTIGGFRMVDPGGNITVGVGAAASGTTLTLAQTAGAYAIDMSAATADLTIGAVATGGNLRWASANYGGMTVASGRTLTINSNFTNQGNNKTIDLNGLGNIVFNGAAGGGTAMGFRITGGANVTMNGAGSWGGTSSKEIINGTLNIGNDAALGSVTLALGGTNATSPTITAAGGARTISNNINLLAVSVSGNATIAGGNNFTTSGIVTNSGANRTLTVSNTGLTTFSGTLALSENTSNRTLTINGAGNLTVSGIVTNGSGGATAAGLTNAGSGLLSLSNANTFGGALTATSGTTRIDNTLAAQNATVSVGAANALAFGTGITGATFAGLSGSGDLALVNTDTNGVTLSVGNNNASSTYSGALSGAGSLTKIGTGTLTLSGNSNAYTGGIALTNGALSIGHSNGAGTSANTITASNGTTIAATTGVGSGQVAAAITLSGAAANVTLTNANASGGFGSAISGSSDQTLTISQSGGQNVNLNATTKQLQNFYGTVSIASSQNLVFRSTSLNNGSDNALFEVNGGLSTRNNGYLALGALSGSGTVSMGGAGGINQALTYTIGARNTDATFSGVIQEADTANGKIVHVIKTGTGTQTFSGANTYSGATTINGGTLALGATGSIDNTSGVSLGTSGTFDVSAKSGGYTVNKLTGSGTVTGALTVSTQLAIGNSPGSVSFSDDLTLGASSTYTYELTGGGSTADLGDVAGDLTITAGAILDLVQLGTYTPNNKFTLFAYDGSLAGTFNGLADDSVFNDAGGDWRINYNDTAAGLNGGIGTSYVTVTAVPEPAAALLGGLGMLCLLRRRRN